MSGDATTGDAKYSELQTHEKDVVERKMDQARKLASKIVGGIDSNGFKELEDLTEDEEIASFSYRMLGLAFNAVEKPVEAANAYRDSARAAQSAMGKATGVALRAEVLSGLGKSDEAESELIKGLREADSDEVIAKYWAGLADVYERTDQRELRALALHNVAKAEGNNAQAWFKAGYAYSHVSTGAYLAILTIHCYRNALYFDGERVWAMNNLGVALNESAMPILAVERYREAAKLGNTLAMANQADMLMRAGFQEEAGVLLDEAASADDVHENVASTKAAMDASRKEQKKKYDEMTAAGTRAGQFLSSYARHRLDATPDIADSWRLKTFDVDVEVDSAKVEFSWQESKYRGHRRFKGVVSGASLFGDFETESSSTWKDDLSWDQDGTGYGYFDADGGKLHLLKLKETEADYFELSAIAPAELELS